MVTQLHNTITDTFPKKLTFYNEHRMQTVQIFQYPMLLLTALVPLFAQLL